MSRNAKILIDLAVLAAVYGIWLLPKWRPLGRRTLAVYTLMYGCLAGIVRFTLMPVLTALPFCLDHPYIPMHMAPFEDVILRHGDYVRQIVLNIALFDFFRPSHVRQRQKTVNFKREARRIQREQANKPYHYKCAVCGRTDVDHPELEFRYCSRCVGYHCFCQDHINNHVHFTE